LVIGLLLVGSVWTLLPFLGALIWASTLAVATWPLLILVQQKTGGRRSVAVVIMTVLILLAFFVPMALAVSALLDAADQSPAVLADFTVRGLGEPPRWVARVPLVGERVTVRWQEIAAGGPEALVEFVRPYSLRAAAWGISAIGGVGRLIVQFLVILVL